MVYEQNKKINIISMFFLVALLFYYLMPAVQVEIKFYIVLMAGLVFTCGHAVITGEQYGVKILLGNVAIAILFYFLTNITSLAEVVGKLHNYFCVCFPAILLYWFLPRSTKKQRWIIFSVAIILYIIVLNNTYQSVLLDENATRSLEMDVEMRESNAGTYDFVYATGVLIPFLGICGAGEKNKWKKTVYAILIVAVMYLLVLFQYTIAILASIISLLTLVLLREKRRQFIVLYLIILITLILSLGPILTYIANMMSSEQISIRLLEIAGYFQYGDTDGYNLSGRFDLYRQALQAFLQHPLIGNRVLEFDSHSTILAILARLGILGGIIYISILAKMKKTTQKIMQLDNSTWKFTPIFVYLIIMALTNPIHASFITSIMVWFIVPLGISLLTKEKKDDALEN